MDNKTGVTMVKSSNKKYLEKVIELYKEKEYERCIELIGKLIPKHIDTDLLSYGGLCHLGLEQYGEALSVFSLCIKEKPDLIYNWIFRGDTYYKLREFDLAADDYKKAFEMDPSLFAALSSYAQAVYLSGNKEEGINIMKEVVAQKEDPNPALILEIMLNSVGLREEARKIGMAESANFPEDKRFNKHRN